MTTVASTPEQIETIRMMTIYHGIKMFLATGIRPNRLWTPVRMRTVAGEITGKTYARGRKGLEAARDDLGALLDEMKK